MWLAIAVLIGSMGISILAPVFTIFQVGKLHMTETQMAIFATAGNLTWALTYPFWGRLVDSKNPAVAWALSMMLYAVLPLSFFFATQWWHVLIPSIIAGTSLGGMDLGFFNAILHYSEEGKETQYQALHAFVQGIRGAVGPFIGAWLLITCTRVGVPQRYLFLLAVAFIIAGCIPVAARLREKRV